jgi:hypothetical protein
MPELLSAHAAVRGAIDGILARGSDPNAILPGTGVNALHLSCYYAMSVATTKRLVAAGGDPYLITLAQNRSPAHMAAEQGNWEELEAAIQAGPDPNTCPGAPTPYSRTVAVPLCEFLAWVAFSSVVNECIMGETKCQRCTKDAAAVPHALNADFFKLLDVLFAVPGWTPSPALRAFLESNTEKAPLMSSQAKRALKARMVELVEMRCGGSSSRGIGAFGGSIPVPEPPVLATATAVAATPVTGEDFTFSVTVGADAETPPQAFSPPGPLFAVHMASAEAAIGRRLLAGMTVGSLAAHH